MSFYRESVLQTPIEKPMHEIDGEDLVPARASANKSDLQELRGASADDVDEI